MDRLPLPVGTLTDIALIQATGGGIVDAGDYLVISSPTNPGYYWGNFLQLLVPEATRSPGEWMALFAEHFPAAEHRVFGMVDAPNLDAWKPLGFSSDVEESLVTDAAPVGGPLADGYTARAFTGEDWAAQIALDMRENDRLRKHDPAVHLTYLERKQEDRRALVEAGIMQWFGAFDAEGTLAASMGAFVCADPLGSGARIARYQHVVTDAEHRRRGLCAHLIGLTGQWAADRGAERWVICTETTNPAGRIYRRAGFAPAALGYGVERQPEADRAQQA